MELRGPDPERLSEESRPGRFVSIPVDASLCLLVSLMLPHACFNIMFLRQQATKAPRVGFQSTHAAKRVSFTSHHSDQTVRVEEVSSPAAGGNAHK